MDGQYPRSYGPWLSNEDPKEHSWQYNQHVDILPVNIRNLLCVDRVGPIFGSSSAESRSIWMPVD